MDVLSAGAGFLIGVGVSVLAPVFWRKLQAGFASVSDRITRDPND